ncbi:MAG: Hypoxanthine/guanine phosphoribosyltransferase [Candidatus Methanofastidiosum methylothiophilum]|jgi:adenine phosphoribosyltransferase|uniref:Adenine phosphoribosyltransferase n=1 Tax=Candidatus Methanofastidiosum methylothiophilum TaxID=1705564 RepID=A0A150JI92_9EURY|nr:MAG: Hypoxanthine/guanine phosphoribosyltransferase [Candidatus Methanofastidiosum methylthiophilus]MBP6932996.1 adenine phosphoribosyltransferase [Methanofastidiosum sp.]OQC51724.1 MAG: Hypoxanthine/guanine phosphoribosyltransferase [Euryarchaeota archaeon ADurb.Bin023]KYC56029.1 MAG: Hypoxanthine/guanine phosphoribosyltransferase [Candidatus Methanofastidiosum methylthiophilus]KYC56915.1 MAG: Hypoxanthine/guanine phosphoribosyltransferase [Candidatus Methanofastidiosum methylthiophilus]
MDKRVESIRGKIRTIHDFPKQGVMFRDITTLLKDREGLRDTIDVIYERYKDKKIDLVAGVEARGFILGGALAYKLGTGFVLIRKRGKLPHKTENHEYELEYGRDSIEVHLDAIRKGDNVLLVDDLIATGGTALAACKLIEKLGGNVVETAFIVGLPELGGMRRLDNYGIFTIVDFEGE